MGGIDENRLFANKHAATLESPMAHGHKLQGDFKMHAEPASENAVIVRIDQQHSPSHRYLTLDHWRGIACLIVVLHHAILPMCDDGRLAREMPVETPVDNRPIERQVAQETRQTPTKRPQLRNRLCGLMHFGVEMFFVISGYCITASAESIRRSGRPIREYFLRRFVRIFPPFWCALICSVLACFVIDLMIPGVLKQTPWPLAMPWDLSAAQWAGSITLTGTWIGYLTGESQSCFPIQSWTLCYEEQFYAVIGVLLACSGRHFFRATAMVTFAVAMIDLLVLRYDFPIKGFFFDEHWFMFAAGVGLYWNLNCATSRQSAIFRTILLSVMIGLAALASTTSIFGNGSHFSAWRVVGALGFAGLLLVLKKYDAKIAGMNCFKGLKSCGVMCYSIYLVHLFPGKLLSQQLLLAGFNDDLSILFLCIPLALSTSISLGYMFHVLVERRFLIARHDVDQKPQQHGIRLNRSDVIPDSHPSKGTLSCDDSSETVVDRGSIRGQVLDSRIRRAA